MYTFLGKSLLALQNDAMAPSFSVRLYSPLSKCPEGIWVTQ